MISWYCWYRDSMILMIPKNMHIFYHAFYDVFEPKRSSTNRLNAATASSCRSYLQHSGHWTVTRVPKSEFCRTNSEVRNKWKAEINIKIFRTHQRKKSTLKNNQLENRYSTKDSTKDLIPDSNLHVLRVLVSNVQQICQVSPSKSAFCSEISLFDFQNHMHVFPQCFNMCVFFSQHD